MKLLKDIRQRHLDAFLTIHNPLDKPTSEKPKKSLEYQVRSEACTAAIHAGILTGLDDDGLTPAEVFEYSEKIFDIVWPALAPPEKKQ